MQYINLTPHTLNMTDGDMPASGIVARIEEVPGEVPGTIRVGRVLDLPDPVEGVTYVVARPLAMAMAMAGVAREDVVVVGRLIRDADGVITGAHGFLRFV